MMNCKISLESLSYSNCY